MRPGSEPAPSHPDRIRSFRFPNECTNCSYVIGEPASAITSRQACQWNSAESTSVPSRSQNTALIMHP